MKRVKITEYAKMVGLDRRTIYDHFKSGKLEGVQLHTGTILINVPEESKSKVEKTVIYCRESTSENKPSLKNQRDRLVKFCLAKGWKVDHVIEEIGSGLNDKRKKWSKLLSDESVTRIVVEHKDRFCRFGLDPIKLLLDKRGCELFIVNESGDDKENLIEDFVSVITSFCARIYGQRRVKKSTEKLIKELEIEK